MFLDVVRHPRTPDEDELSIEASESDLENRAGLPPSGAWAQSEDDAELAAILAWAFVSIWLEWNPPTCPKRLQLDDWYLAPVPFFLGRESLIPFCFCYPNLKKK